MKNHSTTASSGYILVLTLIILSIIVIMVTQLFNKGRVHLYYAKTMIEREQAKQLALGGIQLAMNQLAVMPKQEKYWLLLIPTTLGRPK